MQSKYAHFTPFSESGCGHAAAHSPLHRHCNVCHWDFCCYCCAKQHAAPGGFTKCLNTQCARGQARGGRRPGAKRFLSLEHIGILRRVKEVCEEGSRSVPCILSTHGYCSGGSLSWRLLLAPPRLGHILSLFYTTQPLSFCFVPQNVGWALEGSCWWHALQYVIK